MSAMAVNSFRLTPAARDDLEEIWRFSERMWSVRDVLEEAFERLLLMPEIVREYTEFDPPVRIHPNGEHLIVYRVERDCLAVLRVLGGSRDWHRILREEISARSMSEQVTPVSGEMPSTPSSTTFGLLSFVHHGAEYVLLSILCIHFCV